MKMLDKTLLDIKFADMKIYRPIVYPPHSMKFPNLERNIYIFLAVLLFAGIAFGIYRIERFESNRIKREQERRVLQDRAKIQQAQERKALDTHSAAEVTP